MKKILLIIMLLCIIQISHAQTYGEPYNVTNVDICFGDILVQVNNLNNSEQYELIGCNKEETLWKCPCTSPTTIYLNVKENISNEYNIFIQYYVKPYLMVDKNSTSPTQAEIINDNNKRTNTFNGIKFGPYVPPPKPKEPIKLPSSSTIWIIVVVILILFIGFMTMLFFVYKWLIKGEGEEENNHDTNNNINDDKLDYLRKYVK